MSVAVGTSDVPPELASRGKFVRRLMLGIRIFLAFVFFGYGFVKLAGGQFYYGDWSATKSTMTGTFFVWAFYGYSPFYGRFLGLFEAVPAIFLLFRRTSTAAAAALFAVGLNITVMDFCFNFPGVKYASAFYTFLCLVLMAYDSRKLLLLLASSEESTAAFAALMHYRSEPHPRTRAPRNKLVTGLVAVLVIVLAAYLLNMIGTSLDPGPVDNARAALISRGFSGADLEVIRSRMHGQSGINRTAEVDFRVKTNPLEMLRVHAVRPTGFSQWRVTSVEKPQPGSSQ